MSDKDLNPNFTCVCSCHKNGDTECKVCCANANGREVFRLKKEIESLTKKLEEVRLENHCEKCERD
jgi:hypothetical protein